MARRRTGQRSWNDAGIPAASEIIPGLQLMQHARDSGHAGGHADTQDRCAHAVFATAARDFMLDTTLMLHSDGPAVTDGHGV